jgi:hypothetical protein
LRPIVPQIRLGRNDALANKLSFPIEAKFARLYRSRDVAPGKFSRLAQLTGYFGLGCG